VRVICVDADGRHRRSMTLGKAVAGIPELFIKSIFTKIMWRASLAKTNTPPNSSAALRLHAGIVDNRGAFCSG
jgi:hypothetical protein